MGEHDPLERACRFAAEGDLNGVRDALAQVGPDETPERMAEWILLLASCGEERLAAELAKAHPDPTFRARMAALLFASDDPIVDDGADDLEFELQPGDERASDRRHAELFLKWFGGRRDLYARQWFDERRRRSGYRPVREPLTIAVVRRHLAGRITVGQYLLGPDATASFGVLDLNLSPSALAELRSTRGGDATPLEHDAMRRYAQALLQAARMLGMLLFPEDSGGRGLHLWLFLQPRRPARAARAVLGQIVNAAGSPPPELSVEIFPKQDSHGPGGLSSLVKLPLGVHQATLRRCPLLDDALQPIDNLDEALGRLRAAPPDVIDALVGRRLVALPAPELQPVPAPPSLPTVSSPRSLAEALRALGKGAEARAAAERMLAGCDILAALVRKAFRERHLAPDEARAIAYSLGLVGEECEVADAVLRAANASLKELDRVRRGLPSPVGCARLKALGIAGGDCRGCPAREQAVPYATPALLAVSAVEPASPRHAPFAAWLGPEGPLVETPLETIGRALERIEERLTRLEQDGGSTPPSGSKKEQPS